MAFFAASNPKKYSSKSKKKTQQQKRLARKNKHNQMAAEAKKHKKKNKHKHKHKKEEDKDKDTSNHKFAPTLPTWTIQEKQYIEQQLKQYEYFSTRPHVYPCDNFQLFVDKTLAILDKKKGDFCWSLDWDPIFFSQLIYNGFLTITKYYMKKYIMLPKLHQQRCIIHLNKPLIISKSTKKKSKNYTITIDQCFEKVFQKCIDQHGLNWLYPPMQAVLYKIFRNRGNNKLNGVTAHSIEIWNNNGDLVAGELGTSVGCIYTSLTGFYIESGTGSIQLLILGHMLQKMGFLLWDLGMFIEYKSSLGAGLLKRQAFINKYRKLRNNKNVFLKCKQKVNCRELVNEVINITTEEKKDDVDNKVLSKNQQKRLAKKERRRLAKLKNKNNNNNNKSKDSNEQDQLK
eukprot:343700_1